ncbi:MAG: glycoside hydrolase family 3 C-terminal domain-containing protein [Kiritimatiellae bacterium]|nr:glycoside hydrolase family 3 C-terminal domain-containing protein [Kiritimatiellia bacterium]
MNKLALLTASLFLCAAAVAANAPAPVRLAYNYCTLSYTFAYCGDKEWEGEIDRLAKAGYNVATVMDGTFKVWQLTLRDLGCDEKDILAFIPDECARVWWLMGNLEGEGGPLDQATIDEDARRGRFICDKMRERGIEPLLEGFFGMVPTWLADRDTTLKAVPQGKWGGGRAYDRPAILDPTSDAFARLAAIWYKNLEKVYGFKPKYLAGDLFHEGGKTGDLDVTASVRAVQSAQQKAFPGVTWVVQAWQKNPTKEVRAGLDPRFTLIERLVDDMGGGSEGCWIEGFGELPWIWCEVLNFGGNHGLYGNLKTYARMGRAAKGPAGATFRGYGSLSEGFLTNPVASDLFEEMMMRPLGTELTDDELAAWLDSWVDKRYGLSNSNSKLQLHQAWKILAETAYACPAWQEGAVDNVICAIPSWNAVRARTWAPKTGLYYDPAKLEQALALMEEVAAKENFTDAFKYDLYDLRRQVAANRLRALMPRLKDEKSAREEFIKIAESMCDPKAYVPEEFRLSYWEDLARRRAGERGVKAWRRMITTWVNASVGHTPLEDYANREYPELIRDHYLPRWKKFFAGKDIYHEGWIDFNKNGLKDVYEDPSQPVEKRVADLLSQMTLDEKSCQLSTLYGFSLHLKDPLPTPGWKKEVWKDGIANIDEMHNGFFFGRKPSRRPDLVYPFKNHIEAIRTVQKWFVEETRLGIPVDFSNEGIHGLTHTKATPLPAPIGIGATWNRALVREAGEVVGEEARLIGYSNVYAPILDLARDQRWGRTVECYGEDPFHVAQLGREMALGVQSQGVASTLKHYAAYSVPKGGRDGECRTDPHITPRELHEIHLYPFKRVIREAHPMGVMCSYNDWDGVPVASSKWFLTDLLRGEYGFGGYVVSDSGAVEYVNDKHRVAETYEEAVRMVLEAGLDVRTNFKPPKDFILPIRKLVSEGRLSMETVDRRVAAVLSVKFRLGLFDNPYIGDEKNVEAKAGWDKHLAFADRIQDESLVLLKNKAGTLPFDDKKVKKLLVVGPLADDTSFMTSRYGPDGIPCTSVLAGLRARLDGKVEVAYEKGCEVVDANWPESETLPPRFDPEEVAAMSKAVAAAEGADAIVAVLGEDLWRCGESCSRTSLDLPGHQQQLLERLVATGKPVVLVLVNGHPLTINWANQNVAAIIEAWLPGPRGGVSVAKALFGDINPSGRLATTVPKSIGQIEYNFPFKKASHNGQPKAGPNGSGHTRVTGALYPFGYGLSYTTFEMKNLECRMNNGEVDVSCDVTNTGKRAGAEVVQLYVRDKFSSVVTYDSVLRGFEKVWLEPGETKRITFTLKPDDLAILDADMNWTVEAGDFEIMVGASSKDIRQRATLRIDKSITLGHQR